MSRKPVAGQAAEAEEDDREEKSEEEIEECGEEASSEDDVDEEDGDEEDEMRIAPAAEVSKDHVITYEELRERLNRRIDELRLRGNRCTKLESLNMPKNEKGKESKAKNEKKGVKKEAEEKPDVMYANVFVNPNEARCRKKRRVKNKKKVLEQAKRLQEAKKNAEKASMIAWGTVRRCAAGEIVHDGPKLIKESLKEGNRQQKHAAGEARI